MKPGKGIEITVDNMLVGKEVPFQIYQKPFPQIQFMERTGRYPQGSFYAEAAQVVMQINDIIEVLFLKLL